MEVRGLFDRRIGMNRALIDSELVEPIAQTAKVGGGTRSRPTRMSRRATSVATTGCWTG
jgi:hypothetical protein